MGAEALFWLYTVVQDTSKKGRVDGRVLSLACMDTLVANGLKTTANACHLDVKLHGSAGPAGHVGQGQVHLETVALSRAVARESVQRARHGG